MLKRKIDTIFEDFLADSSKKALLITGARQVGKTYSIRAFGHSHFDSFVEFNFIKDETAKAIFQNVSNEKDILLQISALADKPLIPGKTLIFFDEVQVCPETITYIKFLVEEGSFRYVLSGSLLGVELKNIRSIPVGYMTEAQMFPLDFEEFIRANGMANDVIDHLRDSFDNRQSPDPVVHAKVMRYHALYLITGGMPAVVQKYLNTNDLRKIQAEQIAIIQEYKRDITQYDERLKMRLRHIYDLIPSELNKHNKRFLLKNASLRGRFDRAESDFIWLAEAGVAIPVYNVDEPKIPLALAKKSNLFKLFLNDVGLLCSMYAGGIQMKILNGETKINFGAIYENYVAQELLAHGFDSIYYFNSKKHGEIDFVVEHDGAVLPIEVKSGKTFTSHTALDNLMEMTEFKIPSALIASQSEKIEVFGKTTYMPIYDLMFLDRTLSTEPLIYKID